MFHHDGKLPLLLSRDQDYNKHHGNTEWLMGLENLRKWAKTIMDLKKKMQRGKGVKRLSES